MNEFERILDEIWTDNIVEKDVACLWLLSGILTLQKTKHTNARYQFASQSSSSKSKATPSISKDSATIDWVRFDTDAASIHSKFSNDSIVSGLYAKLHQIRNSSNATEEHHIRDLYVTAIKLNQYNWSAWLELSRLPMNESMDEQLKLMDLYPFYQIQQSMYWKSNLDDTLTKLESLNIRYPNWGYIRIKLGTILHDLRQFKKSSAVFQLHRSQHRYSISGMDIYSNCLYVNEQLTDLSDLAHFWMETNPNASETNIIVGNYYSLKSDHEKAALFFKRATAVDPYNTNAWLLLGHELIELRNPSAALAAYKSAIANDTNDPRCWYSIGQLFELINQHAFAVYYHNKALGMDPQDPRILRALSSCYEKLGRPDEAAKCTKRINDSVKGL